MSGVLTVMVNQHDWDKANAGDGAAVTRLREAVHGLVLYDHILAFPETSSMIPVPVKDLVDLGIVEAITLDCKFWKRSQ